MRYLLDKHIPIVNASDTRDSQTCC